jgi:YVTN family beta-propeller protein
VLAAAVAIPIFAFGQRGSDGAPLEAASGNSVGFIDADSNDLVADVSVGTTPTDVVVGESAVWVTNTADGTVDRIDPVTQTVRQTIRVGNGPFGIAFGDGSVWVTNGASATVSRIDPGSNEVVQTIPVGNGPAGIAVGRGAVWVVNRDSHTLSKIDPAAGRVARTFPVGIEPLDVAVGVEGVWVTSSDGRAIRVDPVSGSVVDTVGVGRRPMGIALGAGSVWVSNSLDGTVSRIDPESSAVTATIEIGQGPAGIAVGPDAVWIASEQDGVVARIDPESNQVVESISVGGSLTAVAIGPGGVFVAVRPGSGAHRGGTLTIVNAEREIGSLDPAKGLSPISYHSLTNDGLTAFKRVGGQEGTQVVPNLATSVPQPTNAGKTYTFRLRKGIRYSNGRTVRADDFRYAFERLFALQSPDAHLYVAIEGADLCLRQPPKCDLSTGIATDDRAGTVTFTLTRPDADLPGKLAMPVAVVVPTTAPLKDVGLQPLPATGPYMVTSYVPARQVRLVRNPRFREWSRTARPDGYPDEIVFKLDVPVPAQIKAVSRGEADITDLTVSGAEEIAGLRTRYGGRVHSDPGPFVVYTFLNTRVSPFDDPRVRRAVNYAVDRNAIVRSLGGPDRASSTCQVLPANYPGYERHCPYERNLDAAKRLVAASGTRGTPVVVWTRASYARFFEHVVLALRELGYPARLKVVDDVEYYAELGEAGPRNIQAGYVGWGAALPSAAEFFQSLLGFVNGATQVSDPTVEREIGKALNLQQTDPLAANEVWARVDRLLVDRAHFVPLYNSRSIAFVSPRVGNYQLHPFHYTLLDQLWVR